MSYFVTTIGLLDDKTIHDCRTVGYYNDYGKAFECCQNNYCDIFENGYYNYAAIVAIDEGLYPSKHIQQWFKYERDKHGIYTIVEYHKNPEGLENWQPYIIG